jgi:hypothetical protein
VNRPDTPSVPPAAAFWLTAVTVAGPLIADLAVRGETSRLDRLYSEFGLIENLTILVSLLGLWRAATGMATAARRGAYGYCRP